MKIDITTTATYRPELLEKTFNSFWRFIFSRYPENNYRLVINIDPVGREELYPGQIEDISFRMLEFCRSYFDDVYVNFPKVANFAKAFKWCWDNVRVDADYVFHIEDDWELLRPVNFSRMLFLFRKYPELIILRLNAFASSELTTKNWNLLLPWNGDFFEVSSSLKGTIGFCGHPSLIDADFIRGARVYLDGIHNPEKEMKGHHPYYGPLFRSCQLGVFSEQNSPPLIKDLGRRWMMDNHYKKKGNKAFFVEWERIDG